jgi:integrase
MPDSPALVTLRTTTPAPSTLTIMVQNRHSSDCPERKDLYSKKCDCRKQLYIYEQGRKRTESAKTRSWEKAEALARQMLSERDPVHIQARKLEEERARLLALEEQRKAAAEAQRVPIEKALDEWHTGLKVKSDSRTRQFNSLVKKIKDWSQENGLTYLDQISPGLLYAWHGQWSPEAENPRDRLGVTTQNQYISNLHRFFKWAVSCEYLLRDPSGIVKREAAEGEQTQPLGSPEDFRQILDATFLFDDNRYRLRPTPLYGRDLRAIFLLQRWTGVRIIDALTLERSAVRRSPSTGKYLMTLITKKNKKLIKDRPLPLEVVEALQAIPAQDHVRPGYYFWSKGVAKYNSLTVQWNQRIAALNGYLSITDEDGLPMGFRSHMLRDTFAVELLLADMRIEKVSELLTHDDIKMTQKYYSPWVKKRREKLHDEMEEAMRRMGAVFTPVSALPAQRLM